MSWYFDQVLENILTINFSTDWLHQTRDAKTMLACEACFYKVKNSRDTKYFFALFSTTIVDNVNQFEKPTIDQIFSISTNFLV